MGMSNKRLFCAASTLNYVYEIVNDEFLDPRHHVHIIQSKISIAKYHPLPATRDLRGKTCCNRGLSHAAFSRRNNDFSCHIPDPPTIFCRFSVV